MKKIKMSANGDDPPRTSIYTPESYRDFLRRASLFSCLSDEAISILLTQTRIREYPKKRILFLPGDLAEHFHLVVDGSVKLYRQSRDGHESVIAVILPGQEFGKTDAFQGSAYRYIAQTVAPSTILHIPAPLILSTVKHCDQMDAFISWLLECNQAVENDFSLESEHLAHMSSAQRVGCFLLRLCAKKRSGSIHVQLPYEKSLVAGRLGMSPETFSRSLNQLGAYGVEKQLFSQITLQDIALLRNYACSACSAYNKECGMYG